MSVKHMQTWSGADSPRPSRGLTQRMDRKFFGKAVVHIPMSKNGLTIRRVARSFLQSPQLV